MALHLSRYRFTVNEFHTMIEAGVFTGDDRLELGLKKGNTLSPSALDNLELNVADIL